MPADPSTTYSDKPFRQLMHEIHGDQRRALLHDINCFHQHFQLLEDACLMCTDAELRNRRKQTLTEARNARSMPQSPKPKPPSVPIIITTAPYHNIALLDGGHPYYEVEGDQYNWSIKEYQHQAQLCVEVLTHRLCKLEEFLKNQKDLNKADYLETVNARLKKAQLNHTKFSNIASIEISNEQEKQLFLRKTIYDFLDKFIKLHDGGLQYKPSESVRKAAKKLANQLDKDHVEGKLFDECKALSYGSPLTLGSQRRLKQQDRNDILLQQVIDSLVNFFQFPDNKKEKIDIELVRIIIQIIDVDRSYNTVKARLTAST